MNAPANFIFWPHAEWAGPLTDTCRQGECFVDSCYHMLGCLPALAVLYTEIVNPYMDYRFPYTAIVSYLQQASNPRICRPHSYTGNTTCGGRRPTVAYASNAGPRFNTSKHVIHQKIHQYTCVCFLLSASTVSMHIQSPPIHRKHNPWESEPHRRLWQRRCCRPAFTAHSACCTQKKQTNLQLCLQ